MFSLENTGAHVGGGPKALGWQPYYVFGLWQVWHVSLARPAWLAGKGLSPPAAWHCRQLSLPVSVCGMPGAEALEPAGWVAAAGAFVAAGAVATAAVVAVGAGVGVAVAPQAASTETSRTATKSKTRGRVRMASEISSQIFVPCLYRQRAGRHDTLVIIISRSSHLVKYSQFVLWTYQCVEKDAGYDVPCISYGARTNSHKRPACAMTAARPRMPD